MRTTLPENLDFFQLLKGLNKGLFRCEALEQYGVEEEDEEYKLYLSGKVDIPQLGVGFKKWLAMAKELSDRGAPLSRVRLVSNPISSYCKYEMDWGFNLSAPAGEDIRILVKDENLDISGSWSEDYYLLDDKRLIYIAYDESGRFLRLEEETKEKEIAQRIADKKRLLERAIPYTQFLSQIRKSADLMLKKNDISLSNG